MEQIASGAKYEFGGKIRYSEISETGRLTLPGLINYFQDVSTFQSEALGVGLGYLKEQHVAWILSSWQVVMDRMPKLCEQVISRTWAYEFKGFYGMRNFELIGEDGKPAAWANSVWVLYDTQQNCPVRILPKMLEKYQMAERIDMEYAPRKIRLPENGLEQESFVIGKHHLDTNHHVNNGQYIAMASEYLPAGFVIGQMRAEYKNQAHLHDEIVPVIYRNDEMITVALCGRDSRPYAVVEFTEK